MAELEGYLQLRDEFGNCSEIVHNCRTLAYLRNSGAGFRPADVCVDCCCDSIDQCEYTTPGDADEPAPWYDPILPASGEFLGLWGSLNLAPPTADDGVVGNKTLTFTGMLLSTTKRGKAFGMEWLSNALAPFCTSCTGREMTVFTHCPSRCDDATSDFADAQDEANAEPEEPNILDLSNLFDAEGCEVEGADDPLEPGPDVEPLDDTGQRDILRVQYVNGSLQELEADFPDCYGCRVTFQFELLDTETFLEGVEICEISPEDSPDQRVPCRRICVTTDDFSDVDPCDVCGPRCDCVAVEPDTLEGSATSNTLADGAAECRYSAPILCKRYACLIDEFPNSQAVPVVSIYAGSQDLENVSVSIMRAVTGLPNPMTATGGEVYGVRDAESTALITRVPAGSTMTLDARSGQSYLDCPGFARQSAAPLVSACGNRKYRHPRLCCGNRYWLAVELDCYTTTHDDWRVFGSIHGVERT